MSRYFILSVAAFYPLAIAVAVYLVFTAGRFDPFDGDYRLFWFVYVPLAVLLLISVASFRAGRVAWLRHVVLMVWILMATLAHLWVISELGRGI